MPPPQQIDDFVARAQHTMNDKDYLLALTKTIDDTPRIGSSEDFPEGARRIEISDTLAKQISQKLKEIAARI